MTRSIIIDHGFEKVTITDRVFYAQNNICRSIKKSLEERTRVPIPETQFREDFESIEEIQSTRHLSAKKINELIDAGYFRGGVMYGKRGGVLIRTDSLNDFDHHYITENSLSHLYSLNIFTIRVIMKNAGISASSGYPNIGNLPYVYQRQHLSIRVQRELEMRANSPKLVRTKSRGPTSAWHYAEIINIERRTMFAIIENNIIDSLGILYDAQTKTFSQPQEALNTLINWRSQYKTNVELAKHLNIDCNALGKRFEYINNTKPIIIGAQKFYHNTKCEEIEHQLKLYVPASRLISYPNFSRYSLRSLEKWGMIKPINCNHPAYCPKMSLYDLSDFLLQSNTR